ncbi:MAG: hypothetical protein KA974_03800 [Saprospiraceae bacterium]|nr:hypothetical protein [Saprospiraceae bacterium]MBP7699468.1 hypothetical protein [Saprospiraceae bacterium]
MTEKINKTMIGIGAFMTLFYFCIGIAMLAGILQTTLLATQYQKIFGVLLLFYGIFRASKTYQAYQNVKNFDD